MTENSDKNPSKNSIDSDYNDKRSSKKNGNDDNTPPGSNFNADENEGMIKTPTQIEDGQSKTMNGGEEGEEEEEHNNTNNNNNGRNNESDDDSDDDNDNVKIVIDFNRPSTQTNPNVLNRQISKPANPAMMGAAPATAIPITTAAMQASAAAKATQAKGIDLEAPGVINDGPTYDYDLEGVKDEDKPWRKPGADITDYFNYGFNEETWIGYCMKQKRLRQENISFKVSLFFLKIVLKMIQICL